MKSVYDAVYINNSWDSNKTLKCVSKVIVLEKPYILDAWNRVACNYWLLSVGMKTVENKR